MECNKDDAVKAKEMAENKLKLRDFAGAKKFALKAQDLYPNLQGLSQLLDVVNIYYAHERNVHGEVDHYGILGVDPSANDDTIRKQFHRLVLRIHPDKNSIDGATGAFTILSEARRVLCDKDERRVYDAKLNLRAPNQASSFSYTTNATYSPPVFARPSTPGSAPSQPYSSFHHPGNKIYGTHFQYHPTHQWTPSAETAASSQYTPSQGPLYPTPGTAFAGQQSFTRSPPIPEHQKTPVTASAAQSVPAARPGTAFAGQQSSTRSPPIPEHQKTPVTASAAQSVPAARPTFQFASLEKRSKFSTCSSIPETFWTGCNRCKIKYEFSKIFLDQNLLCRRCQQPFLAVAMPAPPAKEQDPVVASGGPKNMPTSVATTPLAVRGQPFTDHAKRGPENLGTSNPFPVSGDLPKEKPVKRRRKDGQTSVGAKESRGAAGHSRVKRASANMRANSEAEQPRTSEESCKDQIRVNLIRKAKLDILNQLNKWKRMDGRDSLDTLDQVGSGIHPRTSKSKDSKNFVPEVDAADEYESMVVPDANFHNFDNGRIEESFTEGQIWAAYDDDDGMPRYYALVQHVLSRSPFKMKISWLNSNSSSEFGPLDWTASGFSMTSGNFRTGKSAITKRLNCFSHPVRSVMGARGVIRIFPTKGDVWALYKNWSPNWNETTTDEIIHKYDVVVVVEGYTDDKGVLVAPLVKVPGFTSVFRQHLDLREIRNIPREEIFQFSHQVPFYVLSGLEAENAPKNCYELDPAALPLELLNVITDLDSAERRVSEDTKPLLTYSRRNKEKKIGENRFHSLKSESLDAV